MRVRLTLDVGDFERYVIARYYDAAGKKTRATRFQVRRFALAALRTMAQERAEDMRGRQRGAAHRLRAGALAESPAVIVERSERQPTLF